MKIAYVGNFTQPHCTEVHLALTLEELGHEVVRIQETEKRQNDLWLTPVLNSGVDLFLYTRTWGNMVTLLDLQVLKQHGIPTASYHLDLYVGLQREAGLTTDPFWKTDYVFTPDGSDMASEVFKKYNINHYYMKPGVFKGECKMLPESPKPNLGNDVVFVGSGNYMHKEWPYRNQLVQWLKNTYGNRYSKYGNPERTIRNDELNQLYSDSKVVVGDSLCLNFDHPHYWSDRVYETLGRGGFIIHPFIEGMQEEFTDGENIVFYQYGNWAELQSKIDYYVNNDVERKKIQQAGHEFVKNHATYTNRLQKMLDTVFGTDPEKETLESVKINLGAGEDQFPGWVNVDMVDLEGIDVVHNLMHFPYPFEDNLADEIRAVDVIEHLPPYIGEEHGVIKFLEECHRILKPGAELFIQTPGWKAEFLWIDPTHVRGFDIQSMDFFDPSKHYGQTTGFYSKCKFEVKAEELENHNLRFWMKKI